VTKVAVQCLSAIPPRLGGPGDTNLDMHPAASEVRDGVPPRSLLVEVCVLGLAIRASVVRPLPYPTVGTKGAVAAVPLPQSFWFCLDGTSLLPFEETVWCSERFDWEVRVHG